METDTFRYKLNIIEIERDKALESLMRKREGGELGAIGHYQESLKVKQRFHRELQNILNPKE